MFQIRRIWMRICHMITAKVHIQLLTTNGITTYLRPYTLNTELGEDSRQIQSLVYTDVSKQGPQKNCAA